MPLAVKASQIIHARTKDIDFRSKLLVRPSVFNDSDIEWARKFILDSTRFFESAPKEGRRVVFSNNSIIVSGISINILNLYSLCGKSEVKYERDRVGTPVYAFIGYVFYKRELKEAIELSYDDFLNCYETNMVKRWENDPSKMSEGLEATLVPFSDATFNEVASSSFLGKLTDKQIFDVTVAPTEYIANAVFSEALKKPISFCSYMANATNIRESNYNIVTVVNAEGVIENLANVANNQSYSNKVNVKPHRTNGGGKDNLRQIQIPNPSATQRKQTDVDFLIEVLDNKINSIETEKSKFITKPRKVSDFEKNLPPINDRRKQTDSEIILNILQEKPSNCEFNSSDTVNSLPAFCERLGKVGKNITKKASSISELLIGKSNKPCDNCPFDKKF